MTMVIRPSATWETGTLVFRIGPTSRPCNKQQVERMPAIANAHIEPFHFLRQVRIEPRNNVVVPWGERARRRRGTPGRAHSLARFSSCALIATTTVLADMSTAPAAGV